MGLEKSSGLLQRKELLAFASMLGFPNCVIMPSRVTVVFPSSVSVVKVAFVHFHLPSVLLKNIVNWLWLDPFQATLKLINSSETLVIGVMLPVTPIICSTEDGIFNGFGWFPPVTSNSASILRRTTVLRLLTYLSGSEVEYTQQESERMSIEWSRNDVILIEEYILVAKNYLINIQARIYSK